MRETSLTGAAAGESEDRSPLRSYLPGSSNETELSQQAFPWVCTVQKFPQGLIRGHA